MKYIVHFENVKKAPPIQERMFPTKQEAKAYKAEHPLGKFGSVIPLRGTFGE